MGFVNRLKATLNGLLAPAEDPRRPAPSAHERHLDLLAKLRSALAEVAVSKKRLEGQTGRLQKRLPDLEQQARAALLAGREDQARLILQRKRGAAQEVALLESQVAEVAEEQARLALAEHKLAGQIEAFRTRQEVISARYTAAEAQMRIGEALGGVSRDLEDLGAALDQAEARTEHMQARASAIDELMAAGALPGGRGTTGDAALPSIDESDAVEADLEALRREIVSTARPTSLGADPRPDS